MKADLLSNRYAEALADVVERTGELPRARQELLALADALSQERSFGVMIAGPTHSRRQKQAFFRALAQELGLSTPTRRLLEYLVKKRRTGLLPQIADSFARVADQRMGIVTARLKSAQPLSPEQQTRITHKLQSITGKRIRLEQQLDESLIAGFQVVLDGKFFDGSLRAQLHSIREKIAHAG